MSVHRETKDFGVDVSHPGSVTSCDCEWVSEPVSLSEIKKRKKNGNGDYGMSQSAMTTGHMLAVGFTMSLLARL